MERHFIFGNHNTWSDWGLILTKKEISLPTPKTNYVAIDGMSGSLDLSEALAGEPTYEDRTISADFFTDDGSYNERQSLLRSIIAALHGRKMKIIEPDDPDHYFYGRVTIKKTVEKLVCAEFSVECKCDPWRYEHSETVQTIEVNSQEPVDVPIYNTGVKTACPDITVTGEVSFTCCGVTSSATDGTYKVTTFKLYSGGNVIQVSGNGTLTLRYRRADL